MRGCNYSLRITLRPDGTILGELPLAGRVT
jgi:hypothetical protein